MLQQGTYNALIGQTNYYDSTLISFEDSHLAFKRSLGEGFAWEVLEVYSGPPNVTFTWRHFGKMTDYFCCPGLSDLSYKVDPNQLFTQLTEISPFAPFARLNIPQPTSKQQTQSDLQSTMCNIM